MTLSTWQVTNAYSPRLVDAVVHAAAYFRFAGPRTPYFRTNGATALVKAAEKSGAKTFVYVSGAGTIMDDGGLPICDADESAPTHPDSFSAYLASKSRGEAAVLAANTGLSDDCRSATCDLRTG